MENMGLAPAFGQNNIPVILSANNLYAPYTGVFIQSLIDYACPEKNYDIIIFERDISPENKRLLLMLGDKNPNISIRFYNLFSIFNTIDIGWIETDMPAEVYCKILAPYILPQYPKLLGVDIDTLLKRDISELFEMDIAPHPMGAMLDITWHGCYQSNYVFSKIDVGLQDYCRNTLTMKNPLQYVNGGVLLFDSERYRRELSIETILRTAQSKRFFLAEQDVLNLLMEGKIKFLDLAWNTLLPVNHTISDAIARAPEEGRLAHQKAYEQPYLLHWAAKPKPWVCPDVVLGYEWWAVAQKTPFVGHIIARMFDALEARRQRYMDKYGQNVDAWDPAPEIIKRKPYEARCAPVGR